EVDDAKLIVLPSARVLTESCWQALLQKVEAGATLLVTGYIESDEYWRLAERMRPLGVEVTVRPVAQLEGFTTQIDLRTGKAAYKTFSPEFHGDKIQKLDV